MKIRKIFSAWCVLVEWKLDCAFCFVAVVSVFTEKILLCILFCRCCVCSYCVDTVLYIVSSLMCLVSVLTD